MVAKPIPSARLSLRGTSVVCYFCPLSSRSELALYSLSLSSCFLFRGVSFDRVETSYENEPLYLCVREPRSVTGRVEGGGAGGGRGEGEGGSISLMSCCWSDVGVSAGLDQRISFVQGTALLLLSKLAAKS